MKKLFSFVVVMLCVFSLVACGKKKEESVTFGILGPFTGALSTYGESVRKGAVLAIEDLNAKGGILGKKVEYIAEDTLGDSAQVLSAYNKMADDIDVLIGEVTSGNTEIVASQSNQDGIPTITASATAASVTKNREFVFRTCFLDPDQGESMAKFAKENLALANVAIVYDSSDDYSKGVADAFNAKAKEIGLTVKLYDGGLKAKDNDQRASTVQKLVDEDADCVFAPIYYEDAAALAKELRAAGYTKPLLGADGFDGILGQLAGSGDYTPANNVFFSNHYCATEDSIKEFANKYKEKYGEDPASFAALAYDSVMLAAKAIEEAGSTDKVAVKEALAKIEFKGGLTGDIKFDKEGDPVKTICVCEYKDGSVTLKDKVTK